MWKLATTEWFEADRVRYEKKHSRELAAVMNNVSRYVQALNCSKLASFVRAGYLRPEGGGVVAVDQSAGGGALQATRLYTYADQTEKTLWLIAIGDKQTQPKDIQQSKRFVADNFRGR